MSDTPIHNGWNSVEDDHEHVVPVRGVSEPAKEGVRVPIASVQHSHVMTMEPSEQKRMQLAAFCGIGMVLLLGALFYFGVDSLQGDLTGAGGERKTVTITTEGTFSPASTVLYPGDTLVIENKNPNPQVLKKSSEAAPELFSTQVLFDRPFEFTIPASAEGTVYSYYSETLAQGTTVQFDVQKRPSGQASSGQTAPVENTGIPIPENLTPPEPAAQASTSSASPVAVAAASSSTPALTVTSSSAQSSKPQVFGGTTNNTPEPGSAVITIENGQSGAASSQGNFAQNQAAIPTNPYTVGNRELAERSGLLPARNTQQTQAKPAASSASNGSMTLQAALEQQLHGGAPLQQQQQIKRPKVITASGPAGTWMVSLCAVGIFALCYRRMVRV